eukprot:2159060-Rhodomonas_salina.1
MLCYAASCMGSTDLCYAASGMDSTERSCVLLCCYQASSRDSGPPQPPPRVRRPLSSYAPARRCPVLTWRMT